MPLFYPDDLQHNNPNKALVDITQLRGTSYPLDNISSTGSIPSDKRKIGIIIFASSSQEFYGFYGQTTGSSDWDNPSNWSGLGSNVDTGSFVTTSSFNSFTGSYNTGSFTGSFTGSLQGTSSWAENSLTASYVSASNIDGTVTSASYALTSSYAENAGTASIIYVSESNNFSLNEIEVADFDANVAVTYNSGRLKFIFGTPTSQSITSFSFNSSFNTDRFNQVFDVYTASAIWSNGAYTLVSASIFEGSTLLATTGTGTSLIYGANTTGSHTYTLEVTSSNPLDSSIVVKTSTLPGLLSKINPGNPTITSTPTVQLGASLNQIEQGATGSISFTSASGASNGWVLNFTSTNLSSPIFVTGSLTGSASITINATSSYSSSGVAGSDNNPALITTTTTSSIFSKIRSVRYGASTLSSVTEAQLNDLAFWDTTLGGSVGTIAKGTVNPNNYQFTVSTSAQYIYIVIDSTYTLTGILNVNNSNANDLAGAFGGGPIATIGNYKVYRSNGLSTTSILYKLTT